MKIVILDGYTVVQNDLNWDELKEFGELKYYERTAPDQVIERIGDAGMVITSKCLIDKNVMDKCPDIKYIGVIATGYNNIDIPYTREKNITVTNIPAYSTDSVAQFAFALLLETVNRVGVHDESVHSGDWGKSMDFCYSLTTQREIAGKTMGIIGYGNIGKKVASLANAFGMNVIVYSSHIDEDTGSGNVKFVNLDQLFNKSDFISLHCALTEDNKEFINKNNISKMKDGVTLINTSRGPLINEKDLAESLKLGKISMAALDVLSKEPPKSDNPLINMDNCIITPHIAWNTKEARERLVQTAVDNVRGFINERPVNVV